MKTLAVALVLALSGFGQASAESYYCVELRPRPCEINALTTHQLYSWFDTDLLEVGDIVRLNFFDTTSLNATCEQGQQQDYRHRAYLIPSCGSSGGTNKGYLWFNSNHNGEEFEVVSISPY